MSADTCPCCGSPVRVHTSGEGTSSYEPVVAARDALCGVVCTCGPNREPLACGYRVGHGGEHSWGTLPTFPLAEVAQALRLIALSKRRAKRDLERKTNAAALTVIYALEGAEEALAALTPKAGPVCGRASDVKCEVPLCPYPHCDAFLPGHAGAISPNAEQIERWAEDMGDGWTRLPTSAIDGLLFVLREAAKAAAVLDKAREVIAAADNAWTPRWREWPKTGAGDPAVRLARALAGLETAIAPKTAGVRQDCEDGA